ncbi:hypothetical protein CSOJ01_08291 [Colletotrichum sojae]|uniref:Uncharacterized protein n=1 Tax=Colletotrichum sojae TaxID=2175907 RepID=A0A8H6J6K0_9PEZI|nr:hypothetical protein CSOJ01_08291 [Colletotrichum sojae]
MNLEMRGDETDRDGTNDIIISPSSCPDLFTELQPPRQDLMLSIDPVEAELPNPKQSVISTVSGRTAIYFSPARDVAEMEAWEANNDCLLEGGLGTVEDKRELVSYVLTRKPDADCRAAILGRAAALSLRLASMPFLEDLVSPNMLEATIHPDPNNAPSRWYPA